MTVPLKHFRKHRQCILGLSFSGSLLAISLLISSSMAPEALSNNKPGPAKTDASAYVSDASMAALLKNFDDLSFDAKKEAIARFHSSNTNAKSKEKSAYILARLLQKSGSAEDLKQAIPLYQEAANVNLLWERCQWHIADCANSVGNEELLRESYNNLLKKTNDINVKTKLQYSLAQSYLRAKETDKANEEFNLILKESKDSQFSLGARYYLGQAQFQSGDPKSIESGLKLWREYLQKSPDGRFARDIVKSLKSNTAVTLTAADHLLFAHTYFAFGECAKALAEWKDLQADADWFKQGSALIRSGRNAEGKDLLTQGIKKNPASPEVADAAKLLAHIGTKAEAIEVWKMVQEVSPQLNDMALYNLATRASDPDEALALYEELSSKNPNSDYAPEAKWWIIWDKIKSGKTAEALADLKSCAANFEKAKSGSRYSYWIGKLEEKLQHKDAAKKAYEETVAKFGKIYYGWRAQARLDALAGKADPGWATKADRHLNVYANIAAKGGWSFPSPPQLVSYQEIARECGATAACLCEMHQWDECLELLPATSMFELRAFCLAKMNLPLESINSITYELKGRPNGQAKWELAYPLLHAKTIAAEAAAKKVDPLLAQALIREESRYNIRALSSSKAIGLMQLLPGTAMGVAKRLGVKVSSTEDIHKPENNLKFGIDYMSYTLGRYDGNAMLAVASYNGGPNAVLRWTKQYSLADPDYFVENIPFTETRDYVRKVFGSYWNYVAIYSAKQA